MNEQTGLTTTQHGSIVPMDVSAAALEAAIGAGDFSRLTSSDRLGYLARVCESVGLNPLTKPIDIMSISGKVVMYANKGCAEQLRQIHGVSVEVLDRYSERGCYFVKVRARDKHGRQDEAIGAVAIPDTASGEAYAIASMKAETKAKRRVSLSICGLGMLDVSEMDYARGSVEAASASPAGLLNASTDSDERGKLLDDIREKLIALAPGHDIESKRLKADIMEQVFAARRWETVTHLSIDTLRIGLQKLDARLNFAQETAVPSVATTPAQPSEPSVSSSFVPAPAGEFASGNSVPHLPSGEPPKIMPGESPAKDAWSAGARRPEQSASRYPLDTPAQVDLPTAQCSSGTSESRPYPATPAKVMESAGQLKSEPRPTAQDSDAPEQVPNVGTSGDFLNADTSRQLFEAVGVKDIPRATLFLRSKGHLKPDDDLDSLPLKTAQRIIKNPGQLLAQVAAWNGGAK